MELWEPFTKNQIEILHFAFHELKQLQQYSVMQAEGSAISEGAAVGQRSVGQNGSGGLYCVSSDALVYGKPCDKWCGDKNCWRGEVPSEGVLH